MTKIGKLLETVRSNPKQESFADLQRLLEHFGCKLRQPGGGSSHFTFVRESSPPITIPKARPHVKAVYVKRTLAVIDDLQAHSAAPDDGDSSL